MGKEAGTSHQPLSRPAKRRAGSTATSQPLRVRILLAAAELLHIRKPAFVYDMRHTEERAELIKTLWTGDYTNAIGSAASDNEHLDLLLQEQTLDDFGFDATDGEVEAPSFQRAPRALKGALPRFEGVLTLLFRARSIFLVPLFVAALSVRALHYRTPRRLWDALVHFSRVLMSRSWTEGLCEEALASDPGAPYATAAGMSGAVFDNFTIKVGYGSYSTIDSSGTRFDMTNWASVLIPADAVPAGFDIDAVLAAGGIFRTDRRLVDFADLFDPASLEIIQHQQARWREYLGKATAGTLLDKPDYDSPFPPTHFHWHPPIRERLQSSYDDVNFEIDTMRTSVYHQYSKVLFLGGDGLSYMRLIHRLKQDPRRYMETTPIIIPQLGEHPHGTFHVLHGCWRLWWPLLEKFAHVAKNKQVRADPIISAFNEHEHFMRICARACAEYVVEISATGSDYRVVGHFLRAAERNLSFAYVCYFLHLAAFPFLQMRNAVRQNDSDTLDLIWREFLATGRTSLANKTNYSQMSIVRVYWGWALVPPMQAVYRNVRTLRHLFTHVGWDWPIEYLNLLIREGVQANITWEQIEKFIRRLNFTAIVNRGLDAVFRRFRRAEKATDRDVDTTVEAIKDFLRESIGTTFSEATTASDDNLLDLDLTNWGGSRYARREAPWAQMAREMADVHEHVTDEVKDMCRWHRWAP